MGVRTSRWWLFLTIALTVPLPMVGPYDAWVPAVRYLILASATASVMWAEGAAGPVPAIFLLFAVHAVVYLLLVWGAAWFLARMCKPLSLRSRGRLIVGVCSLMFFLAIVFDLYATPFGRSPAGNLLSVLS